MLPKSGGYINLECKEQYLSEYPDLLFGEAPNGRTVFDMSAFLQSTDSSLTVDDFFKRYKGPIDAIVEHSSIPDYTVSYTNSQNHVLVDSTLTYLCIAFADSRFMYYMCERMDDLFTKGFAVSDTYLAHAAVRRIPREIMGGLYGSDT